MVLFREHYNHCFISESKVSEFSGGLKIENFQIFQMICVFNEFEQNFKFPRNIKIYLDKINKTASLYFSNCV